MISRKSNPVAWALLAYELDDAAEHLQQLIDQMAADGNIDEVDFKIQLAHVYAHLNRVWHARDGADCSVSSEAFRAASQFPTDLQPT